MPVPDTPEAHRLWNSLEIATLVVNALTPLAVVILGFYLARLQDKRVRAEDSAQERSRVLQRLPIVLAAARETALRYVSRSCLIQAMLVLGTKYPQAGFEASIEETKKLYAADLAAFEKARNDLRESIMAVEFTLGPKVSDPMQQLESALVALLSPNESHATLQARLIEEYERTFSEGRVDEQLSRAIAARLNEFGRPLDTELQRLAGEIRAAVGEALGS